MNPLFPNPDITQQDIMNLMGLEESVSFEIKNVEYVKNPQNIAKAVCAFANSAGGVIVFGINEKNHRAHSVSFIDGNQLTKETLERIISTNIHRKIEGLRITPVRFDDKIEQTVYVVEVPESSNAPHMANKKYYRRYNFEAVGMEEYEVRNMYGRLTKTELVFDKTVYTHKGYQAAGPGKYTFLRFNLNIQIKNISEGIELHYKVELHVPDAIYAGGLLDHLRPYWIRFEDRIQIYSIPNTSPLFQNEVATMPPVSVQFTLSEFNAITAVPIVVKLYYSNGVKEMKLNPAQVCFMDSQPITRDMLAVRN